MKHMVGKYWRIWKTLFDITLARHADVRLDFVAFFFGKIIRMLIVFGFTASIFRLVPSIGGFNKGELLLLFAVMNFLDVMIQLLCRGLGHVHEEVHRGSLDVILTKPISPLFWSTFRIFDMFDLTTLPIMFWIFWYAFHELPPGTEFISPLLALLLLAASFLIAFAFNVIIATVAFWTEMGANYGPWFLYRHFLANARMPGEIFPSTVSYFFTFLVPFLLIVSFPVRALFGKLSLFEILIALALAVVWLAFALWLWRAALRRYTSASS